MIEVTFTLLTKVDGLLVFIKCQKGTYLDEHQNNRERERERERERS